MILDELIKESFDLDYEILYKPTEIQNFEERFRNVQSKDCKDLFQEIKLKCDNLEGLLRICDIQRKNFRIVLVHLMKEKKFYDEYIGENDSAILFNKIKIHEELKNRLIDEKSKKIEILMEQLRNSELIRKENERNTIESISVYSKPSANIKTSMNIFNNPKKHKKKEIKNKILNNVSISPDNSRDGKAENTHSRRLISKDKISKSPDKVTPQLERLGVNKSPLERPFNGSKSQITIKKPQKNQLNNYQETNKTSFLKEKGLIDNKFALNKTRKISAEKDATNKSTDFNLDEARAKLYNDIINTKQHQLNLSTLSSINSKGDKAMLKSSMNNNTLDSTRNKKVLLTSSTNCKTASSNYKANNLGAMDRKKILDSIERDFYEHFSKGKAHLTPILQKYDKAKK